MNVEDLPDDDRGQAIKRWALEGSDLKKPMKIDFFIEVIDSSIGAKLSVDPALADFEVSTEKDDETGRWTCFCSKTMVPDYKAIVKTETLLTDVARQFEATYDGFGSFGNADQ